MSRRPRRSAHRAQRSLIGIVVEGRRRRSSIRRLIAIVASLSLALSGLLVLSAPAASAADFGPTRAFTPVFTANTTGDVIIRGNNLETCVPKSLQAQGTGITCEQTQAGTSQQNNNYFMTYIDADGTTGGNTTFDSSSATVTVPTGATVLYAGLSWGAVTTAGALDNYPALTGVAAPNAALLRNALFQAPGASSYSTVTSTTTDINQGNYQAYVDVTSTVKAAGSGTYSVANVQAGTGGGNYAGWSLAVAYSDPTMPTRNLTVFTGYNQVSTATPSVDISVSGFLTPATGAVTTKIGVVAYEGDKGATGDGMSVGGTSLYNSLNPINDVFNSSLTDMNVAVTDRTPNYANMLGFDIDRLDATGVLPNGATSTTVHLTTAVSNGETYYPGMLTFATNLYASGLTATKSVVDVNGGDVRRNDRLDYSVTVTNGGSDGAAATVLTDAVPAGTTYAKDSLKINGTAVTDVVDTDAGDASAVTGNVTARLGTGATGTTGGLLLPNASATVTFSVYVNSVADGTKLVNTALFTNKDQTTGTGYSGGSNTVTSTVVGPALDGALAAGEVTAPYSSGFSLGGSGAGPYVWTISSGTLPAGLSINSSTGLITGTPTAAGNYPITVLVTDANNRTATRAQTLVVAAGPTVAFTPQGGEVGVGYTAQPTASGGTGPYTWSISAGTLPAGLSINATTGAITGTPTAAAVGATTVTVQATDAVNGTAGAARTITIVAAPTLTGTLPGGELTAPYSGGFTVSDGTSPYVWALASGPLPAGLSLNTSTGLITGTPTATGSTAITVRVTDAKGSTTTRDGTIAVTAGPAVAFSPPTGEVGVAYTAQPTASGGTPSYTWSVSMGTLPAGLSINTTTGAITGTPTAAGSSSITLKATDAANGAATQAGTITIVAAPTLTFTPPTGEVGVAYTAQPTASGGTGSYTWSVSTGTLPAGLSINPTTGAITGTPTAVGSSSITVKATDAANGTGTQAGTIVVNKTTSTVTVAAPPTAKFGTAVTITAAVGPSTAGGTVTFTDVPTTGPQAGTTVTLGTGPVSGAAASLTVTLPAFGVNTIKATYSGDANNAAATSTTTGVEVSAYAGEVIVTEFRTSGPNGANDSYVELLNTGPTVPLGGIKITADSGAVSTLPATAGLLATGRSYLLTGSAYSLGAEATSDYSTTIGTGGVEVTAPDTAHTQTDAVGPSGGFHLGTAGLPVLTGTPTAQWAWVRSELAGAAVDSHNNAADFQLVSTTLATVGGVQPTLGSASPTGTADPYQHNATLQSTLLDTGKDVAIAPNRVVVAGTPRHLVIRRTITNNTGQTITSAKVRISALSEQYGAKQPGVATPPANKVWLRAINPSATTEQITLTSGATVTVQDLSVDAPNSGGLGGGLNSTFTVPLGGGLAPGAKINVAFTFAVDTGGTFWFGYDVDAK